MGKWIHRKYTNALKAQRRAVWQRWDWKLQDTVLAKIHGVSRERARQIRVLLKKPKAVAHGQFTHPRRIQSRPKKSPTKSK